MLTRFFFPVVLAFTMTVIAVAQNTTQPSSALNPETLPPAGTLETEVHPRKLPRPKQENTPVPPLGQTPFYPGNAPNPNP